MSMPWLAFVNIAFALMIFFRNFIFTYFDKRLLTHRAVIPYIEAALIAVIIISAILVIIALTPRLTIYVEYHHRAAAGAQSVLVPE